jgi:hypothetical protein
MPWLECHRRNVALIDGNMLAEPSGFSEVVDELARYSEGFTARDSR